MTVHTDSPRLHAALQSLQTSLDQVERLEQQCGAGPTEGATHEGFNGRVYLGGGVDLGGEKKKNKRQISFAFHHCNI